MQTRAANWNQAAVKKPLPDPQPLVATKVCACGARYTSTTPNAVVGLDGHIYFNCTACRSTLLVKRPGK